MENKQPKLLYTYNNMNELKEEMATHSNSLAWKSHEQRNLVGYIVHGVTRVRHNLVSKQQIYQEKWMVFIFNHLNFPGEFDYTIK